MTTNEFNRRLEDIRKRIVMVFTSNSSRDEWSVLNKAIDDAVALTQEYVGQLSDERDDDFREE